MKIRIWTINSGYSKYIWGYKEEEEGADLARPSSLSTVSTEDVIILRPHSYRECLH